MKLVDILAKGLKSWPEGLECLSQLKGTGYIINGKGFDGRAFDALQIADETLVAGAIVTRAEWQAAVDALNAPKVVEWPSLGETVEVIKGPAEWDDYQRPMIGVEGKVRSVFKNDCDQKIVAIELSSGECKCFIVECIKPARTAEQVAAEERINAITEMRLAVINAANRKTATTDECLATVALYDAGYRRSKQ